MPAGKLEKICDDLEGVTAAEFTNGYIALYAKNLSERVRDNEKD